MVVMVYAAGSLLRLVQVEVHKNKEVCLYKLMIKYYRDPQLKSST